MQCGHGIGGAEQDGEVQALGPFFKKTYEQSIQQLHRFFFKKAQVSNHTVHSAILLRFWAGLLTIHALQEKATLCHLAYAPTRARDVETLPNMPRLQLKRSLEAATLAEGDMSDAPCGRRLLCIWRMALEVRMFFRAFKLNRLKRNEK